MTRKYKLKIAFFGTSQGAVIALEELKNVGLAPSLVITTPDKPKGRKLVLSPPLAKVWAEKNNVNFVQSEKLDETLLELLREGAFDLFVVASYGKLLSNEFLALPKHGTLNVHPSLLPKLRGPSPIVSAILEDEKKTGVTIILLDEGLDSGPVVAQASIEPEPWPPYAGELEELLLQEGTKLLIEILPEWVAGKIKPEAQDENKATFTKKIKKEDGLIELDGNPYQNLLKIRAFDKWPGAYFFADKQGKKIRVKITDADLENDTLKINKVIPEGKKEMDYEDFLRG
ncbi:MAG: methionyl-tRNA formyltransferase [Candidatus Pacebacteria bacterium]|jgi:methionyl-tRNA formyltransferase|nr:methionyl-tRNA formyltransferase [Parcubacteria group bacterium]MDP6249313.1 methionyl-tRNA formyltransferase [Candidatus Paceibacterota bacterium]MDP7159449.1 methionyl-tRNA formyltransferase [Candidatus Paceibacterota bacterium]MDP7365951.1 methionyl-tRNA formyltransferase [Candidatus Paceibacterota bacterium]MDP7466256.1 methionyl-tRNA formyltransferase [Candidatus Paceibacterota bacterium]|tara:strand:- start:1710 stop:2567 length:858 start_codon:yes stop_codon:yes gene_type:complete